MTLQRSIMLPLMITAAAVLCAALITSGMLQFAGSRRDVMVSAELEVTLRADRLNAGVAAAEAYVRDVMSMTRLIPQFEVQTEFRARSKLIEEELASLQQLSLRPELETSVQELSAAYKEWCDLAVVVMGIKPAAAIPTQWALDDSGRTVTEKARLLVASASDHAARAIGQAGRSTTRILLAGMAVTMLAMAFALLVAFKQASSISGSILDISSKLRGLASGERVRAAGTDNEIGAVFEALDTLESSLKEKRKLTENLREAKNRAEAATEAKSRFLATMSHEIRTPINGVMGMAEVLGETGLTAEQRLHTDTILSSSGALLRIVNDILDFSKLEEQKTRLHEQPFDLQELIYDVAALLSPEAGRKGVHLAVGIAPAAPLQVAGDSGRLRQILMNLAGNAVKFTREGHVGISLDYDRGADLPLLIRVEDSGIGIPEDSISSIFNAFEQVDSRTARQFEGTGLGLAISARLAKAMGGKITVRSALGSGSCFLLALPLPALDEDGPDAEQPPLAGRRILLAAALDFSRQAQRRQLEAWGAEVLAVTPETLADSGLPNGPWDAVVGDSCLPDEQARTLCREAAAPVILCSRNALPEGGTAHVLMPPLRKTSLLQALLGVTEGAGGSAVRTPAPAAGPAPPADFSHLRILVAEDNRTNQLVLEKMLAPTGAALTFCADGQAAVDNFLAHPPDLIFMDVSMPVMDGLQAATMIRSLEQGRPGPACPVIALTANVMDGDQNACLAAGMSDFLGKPLRKAELLEKIRQWAPPAEETCSAAR